MPSPEFATVLSMLRSRPALQGSTVLEMRAHMDAATGVMPPPQGVDFEPVDAGGVRAEWTRAECARSDRAIVYLHGGGYVMGGLHTHRGLVAELSRAAAARVLSVDYRLGPEHPFPAALEDAAAAYHFALSSGLSPSRLAIAGDSAGGGLTAATLLALRDAGTPLPAAGVCISPWLDLTQSGESMRSRAAADPMVQKESLDQMAAAYLGTADPRQPLASPLFGKLAGLPPLLIHVGTAETLLDDSRRFAERARAAGVEVQLEAWEEMIHVWHAFAAFLPEARQAVAAVGHWLGRRWS